MHLRRTVAKVDDRIEDLAERTYRRMGRRDLLRGSVVTGVVSIAALALGERPAGATTCDCGPTGRCSGCAPFGCPSGYSLCKGCGTCNCFNSSGFRCEWPGGTWIACTGLGTCGAGYRTCYDCIGPSGCKGWCTCLGSCVCCTCCTAAEVKAEQKRIQELQVAAGA